jgi:hypothetical protein
MMKNIVAPTFGSARSELELSATTPISLSGEHMSRAARLGAFIVTTLAILAVGTFIIGNKQYLFTSTYQLKAQFSNVVGLDVGAGVRVGGVYRGTVHGIELPHRPGDKITVVMDLDSSTHEIIKQDSIASIETEGLLGNEYLEALKCRLRSWGRIALHPRPPQNCRFPSLPLPFQNHSSPEAPAKVLRPRT